MWRDSLDEGEALRLSRGLQLSEVRAAGSEATVRRCFVRERLGSGTAVDWCGTTLLQSRAKVPRGGRQQPGACHRAGFADGQGRSHPCEGNGATSRAEVTTCAEGAREGGSGAPAGAAGSGVATPGMGGAAVSGGAAVPRAGAVGARESITGVTPSFDKSSGALANALAM